MAISNPEGASATYRGYRRQALYTLARLLTDSDAERRIYRPEGAEDLAIFDEAQRLAEVVQVKDYTSDLALSHFKPSSPDGFFARFNQRRRDNPQCVTRLASFGKLGPQLQSAIEGEGPHRASVVQKLLDANRSIAEAEAKEMLEALQDQVEHPDAAELHARVLRSLEGTIAGGHAPSTMELLMYWVFDASENQRDLTRAGLLLQLERIGAYLAALRDTSHEWGVSVRPLKAVHLALEDADRLRHEYRRGVQAQWEHILADADCDRPQRLAEIHRLLQVHSVVIVRGASGQGKSSLAWRYMRDYCADGLRFHVRIVEGREHALRVANALHAHVMRLRLQAAVCIDLSPSDTGWADLVRDLALAGLKVLVAVREEDFARAALSVADFDYAEVILDGVTREEAEPIFTSLRAAGLSSVLDFEEAWARFSVVRGGPLLEFTHLITEGESLTSRIQAQVLRLQRDAATRSNGITPAHLDLLAFAAIANSAGSRVELRRLCDAVGLPPITRPLALLENEYLLRQEAAGDRPTVGGVHILRSRAVVAALLEECPERWSTYAQRSLPLVIDEDVESFLLSAFSRCPENGPLLESELRHLAPRSWVHAAGITRALLWAGVSRYERENADAISAAIRKYNRGWSWACDAYIGLGDDFHRDILDSLAGIIHHSIEPVELTPKANAFAPFETWACTVPAPPSPERPRDWAEAGEVAYWIGHRQLVCALRTAIEDLLPDPVPQGATIQEMAAFTSGREKLGDGAFRSWHDRHCAELVSRFARESDSIHVTDDGHEVKVYFSVPIAHSDDSSANWNDEAMKRLRLLRKLFPVREWYGSQGIGLEVLEAILPNDPTFKRIPAEKFPAERAVALNALFRGLVSYRHMRPDSWKAYAETVLAFRDSVSNGFRLLHKWWSRLLSDPRSHARTLKKFPAAELGRVVTLSNLPLLPRCGRMGLRLGGS